MREIKQNWPINLAIFAIHALAKKNIQVAKIKINMRLIWIFVYNSENYCFFC